MDVPGPEAEEVLDVPGIDLKLDVLQEYAPALDARFRIGDEPCVVALVELVLQVGKRPGLDRAGEFPFEDRVELLAPEGLDDPFR